MGTKSYVEEILQDWKPRIKMLIRRFAFGAKDKELLENELLEKVYQCISDYDDTYEAKFETFTNRCLTNHIQVHLRGEQRIKHSFISSALSLDYCVEDGDTIVEMVASPKAITSDALILSIMIKDALELLPDVCKDIVFLLSEGASETEIARAIGEESQLVRGYIEECIQPLIADMIFDEEENYARKEQ